MIVEVEDVSKTIASVEVLRGISMTLSPGSVTGLSGVNGSGKTMLMRVMLGLVRPTSGRVTYDGALLGKDFDFPPSVGALIEEPSFLPSVTGLENLRMVAAIREVIGEDDICEALELLGLDPADRRPYRKYSLGMRQRLGIACAAMEHPDVLMLDEPTNALDEDGVRRVEGLVRRERDRGAVVVLASHDRRVMDGLADEEWILAEGHIEGHIARGDRRA